MRTNWSHSKHGRQSLFLGRGGWPMLSYPPGKDWDSGMTYLTCLFYQQWKVRLQLSFDGPALIMITCINNDHTPEISCWTSTHWIVHWWTVPHAKINLALSSHIMSRFFLHFSPFTFHSFHLIILSFYLLFHTSISSPYVVFGITYM